MSMGMGNWIANRRDLIKRMHGEVETIFSSNVDHISAAMLHRDIDEQQAEIERLERAVDLEKMLHLDLIEELKEDNSRLRAALQKIHKGRTATREVLTAGELRMIARAALKGDQT